MLIDTHCHLDAAEFDADRDQVHAAALAAGVERIIVPNATVGTLKMAKTTVERYAGCVAAYGIHPLYADIMRCTLAPGQDLINVFRGYTAPTSLATISPDAVVIYRQTDSTYLQVLIYKGAEVVIRKSSKRHCPRS